MLTAPKQCMEVNPLLLAFDLKSSISPSATVTLTNTTEDEALLFKVRTTNPKRYLVKPNQEVIMPGDSATVTIQLQAGEAQELLETALQKQDQFNKDKFMISYVSVDEPTQQILTSASAAGIASLRMVSANIWSSTKKDDVINRRIRVEFILPEAPLVTPAGPVVLAAPVTRQSRGCWRRWLSCTRVDPTREVPPRQEIVKMIETVNPQDSKPWIAISPREVTFDFSTSVTPTATVTVTNTTTHSAFVLKLRTTNPKGYICNVNQEVIMPNSSVTITLQVRANDLKTPHSLEKDKFMISYSPSDESMLRMLRVAKDMGGAEYKEVLNEFWANKGKGDYTKFAVKIICPKIPPVDPPAQVMALSPT